MLVSYISKHSTPDLVLNPDETNPLLSSALNQSEAEVTSRRLGTVATGAKRINKLAYRVLW